MQHSYWLLMLPSLLLNSPSSMKLLVGCCILLVKLSFTSCTVSTCRGLHGWLPIILTYLLLALSCSLTLLILLWRLWLLASNGEHKAGKLYPKNQDPQKRTDTKWRISKESWTKTIQEITLMIQELPVHISWEIQAISNQTTIKTMVDQDLENDLFY